MSNQPVLKMEHITKVFPGVIANDDISLEIQKKEILSIIGENGAGKSTFCKMLTGAYKPDDGEIWMNGKKVQFRNTTDSMHAGISMVYQERNLVPLMNGAQNVCLGYEPLGKNHLLNEKAAMARAIELRDQLGVTVPLDVPVEQLGAGEQQLLEIMRALNTNPQVLILDEPTASLSASEIAPFLEFIKSLREKASVSIIFISHKIEEVFEISDKIAVFTDGKNTLTANVEEVTQEQCISAMLRRDKIKPLEIKPRDFSESEVVLDSKYAEYDGKKHNIEFKIHEHEIVGFYGLVGSGRTECFEMIAGLRPSKNKELVHCGEQIKEANAHEMIRKGVIMTPEKRANGMFRTLSLVDNICMLFWEERLSSKLALVNFKKSAQFANEVLRKNKVKYSSSGQMISGLSGGNIQKIIIGRSIEVAGIRLLILDEPTVGMDIGAKHGVYEQVRSFAEEKPSGVAFISSELDELLAVCDTIYVFAGGNIIQGFHRSEFEKAKILEAAIREKRV